MLWSWRIHNIGNRNPIEITEVVRLLEVAIGRPAVKVLEPLQPGEVTATYADVGSLEAAVDFRPDTPIESDYGGQYHWEVIGKCGMSSAHLLSAKIGLPALASAPAWHFPHLDEFG